MFRADEPKRNWFAVGPNNDAKYDLAGWAALTGEADSTVGQATYPDPGRVPTPEERAALRAGLATPAQALAWIRAGFGR